MGGKLLEGPIRLPYYRKVEVDSGYDDRYLATSIGLKPSVSTGKTVYS